MKLTRSMLLSIQIKNVIKSPDLYKVDFSVYGNDEIHYLSIDKRTEHIDASFDVDFGIQMILGSQEKSKRLATYFLGMLLEHNKLSEEDKIIVQDARNFILGKL